MAERASDTFSGGDADPLNTNWTQTSFGSGRMTIVSGQVVVSNVAHDAHFFYSGGAISWPNDQYSEAAITVVSSGVDGSGYGISVRSATDGSANFYEAVVDGGTPASYVIYKVLAGTPSILKTGTVSRSAGDVLRLEVVGTTLTLKNAGTIIDTVTDSSSPITSGAPGIGYTSAGGDITSGNMDNWAGGDFSATFAVSPTMVPANNFNPIVMSLIGVGTNWVSNAFTISGVSGVTKFAQNIINTTSATITINTGVGTGTVTVSDGAGTTQTFQVGSIGSSGYGGGVGLNRGMD